MNSLKLQSIPIEILRTAVAIADAGTFTKAASRLGIGQPAVSAQVKRLQQIVGGDIFLKDIGRIMPTSLGITVLLLARKTLETHDQILRLSASSAGPERVRLGFSPLLVARFMSAQSSSIDLSNVFVQSDQSDRLIQALLRDRLDIACCLEVGGTQPANLMPYVIAESEDELVWVRSNNFVVSPGKPVPIVSWRGDDWMTAVLSKHGLLYQIVFDGEDFESKRSAVEAGQGLTALPSRAVPPTLVRAREYYLPQLPSIRTVLYAKYTDRSKKLDEMIGQVRELFVPKDAGPNGKHRAV